MTIASVSAGQTIDPDWGNSVADAINGTTPAALSYATDWSGSNGRYYLRGPEVVVHANVTWGGGTVSSGNQTFATLPSGFRPAIARNFVCWYANSAEARLCSAATNGALSITDALTTGQQYDVFMLFSTV